MKRGSSATSLHNLALSIKNSIIKDFPKGHYGTAQAYDQKQRRLCLGRTKSTISLNTKANNLYFTPLQQTISAKVIQKNHRKSQLKIQMQRLQDQIASFKQDNAKFLVRNYNKQLQLYDQANKQYKIVEKQILKKKEELYEIANRMGMVREDLASRQFNTNQVLAQKQYYQEILETYQNQYQSESQVVLEMVKLQIRNTELSLKVNNNTKRIELLVAQLQQWKQQYQYEFNSKKTKGKITQARVQLMNVQQKADQYAKEKFCMKIRELLCIFIKKYTNENYKVTKKSQLQQGLEFYICKEGICKKLKQFLLQKNCEKPQYQTIISSYCKILQRMQNIVINSEKQAGNKIVDGYNLQIEQLSAINIIYNDQIKQNKQRMTQRKNKLDLIFGNENVVLIQIMREKTGKIELDSIKSKLKEMANDQQKRVNKMKEIYKKSQSLKLDQQYYFNQKIVEELRTLAHFKQKKQQEIQQIRVRLKKSRQQKAILQEKLSDVVNSWKQRSDKNKKLKKLYKQLQQYQNQKFNCFQQENRNTKTMKKYDKENIEPIGRILSSQTALSTNFRNNSNRTSNELKIHRKKSASVLTQPVTYKNSMTNTTKKNKITEPQKDLKKRNLAKQSRANTQRRQLTNLLISKFVRS